MGHIDIWLAVKHPGNIEIKTTAWCRHTQVCFSLPESDNIVVREPFFESLVLVEIEWLKRLTDFKGTFHRELILVTN